MLCFGLYGLNSVTNGYLYQYVYSSRFGVVLDLV